MNNSRPWAHINNCVQVEVLAITVFSHSCLLQQFWQYIVTACYSHIARKSKNSNHFLPLNTHWAHKLRQGPTNSDRTCQPDWIQINMLLFLITAPGSCQTCSPNSVWCSSSQKEYKQWSPLPYTQLETAVSSVLWWIMWGSLNCFNAETANLSAFTLKPHRSLEGRSVIVQDRLWTKRSVWLRFHRYKGVTQSYQ